MTNDTDHQNEVGSAEQATEEKPKEVEDSPAVGEPDLHNDLDGTDEADDEFEQSPVAYSMDVEDADDISSDSSSEEVEIETAPCDEENSPLLDPDQLDRVLLSLLFVADNSVPVQRFLPVFETEANLIAPKNERERKELELQLIDEIVAGLERIAARFETDESSPLQLVEIAGGYQLCTKPEMSVHIDRFFERRKRATLSGAALETLAIIAYQQPITRAELEAIRGVNVDYIVHSLLERRLIRVAGRKDAPGKPFMYRTTRFFLEYFGLGSLDDLPQVDELREAFSREPSEQQEGLEEDAESPVEVPSEAASSETEALPDSQDHDLSEPTP